MTHARLLKQTVPKDRGMCNHERREWEGHQRYGRIWDRTGGRGSYPHPEKIND